MKLRTSDDIDIMVRLYESGSGTPRIAKVFDTTSKVVYGILKNKGVKIRSVGGHSSLPNEYFDDLYNMYQDGMTVSEISRTTTLGYGEILGLFDRNGIITLRKAGHRRRGSQPKDECDVVLKYEKGRSMRELGEEYGISRDSVKKILVRYKTKIRPAGRFESQRRTNPDCADCLFSGVVERNCTRCQKYRKIFGVTFYRLFLLYKKQDGKCAICEKEIIFPSKQCNVDHDHVTGSIRGLLCLNCNTAIGLFSDNIQFLKNAIKYLGEDSCNHL